MDKVSEKWPVDGSVGGKWLALHCALMWSLLLRFYKVKQSDWFLESADVLQPFLKDMNDAYNKINEWLMLIEMTLPTLDKARLANI